MTSAKPEHAVSLTELECRLSAFQERVQSRMGDLEGEIKTHRQFLFGNGHGGITEMLTRIDLSLQSLQEWQREQESRALAAERSAKDRTSRAFLTYLTLGVTIALTMAGWAVTLFGGGV